MFTLSITKKIKKFYPLFTKLWYDMIKLEEGVK